MIPIAGQPILTAAQMRAAEDRAVAGGAGVATLMERAGAGVAETVRRLAAGSPVLMLCGPGNNGGDGYVAARVLRANGVDVRVAASGESQGAAAVQARQRWPEAVEPIAAARDAPVLVDAVFGTGLSRRLGDPLADLLSRLQAAARLTVAVDLPSGVATDTGELLRPRFDPVDVTLALGAVKPAHVLGQACGEVRLIDIGVVAQPAARVIDRPELQNPDAASTKYTRGMVAVIAGAMPGAAALASQAAMRSGAGYVLLLADDAPSGAPHALVHKRWSPDALDDERIGAVLIGPGLGRDDAARARLDSALTSPHSLVIDGDALHLLADRTFHDRAEPVMLTPHGGEFRAAFGDWSGSKIDATRAAAERSGAIVVFKGPDTVIAAPSGEAIVAPAGASWLSTAGTGDVLAGAIAAQLATLGAVQAASAGVWMHADAARRLGGAFIADDLARELSAVRAEL